MTEADKIYQKKRFSLWLSIGIFSIMIVGLWAWNLTTLWQEAKIKNATEKSLLEEAKNTWDNVQAPVDELSPALQTAIQQEQANTQAETESAKNKIKNILEQINTTTNTP